MTITVTPLTPTIGAELSGVDLTQELDEATITEIREALLAHLVIFFRDQPMQPTDHVRFARAFGEISLPAFRPKASLSPEVVVLDQTNPRGEGADRWHTDNTYMVEPPMGSVLRGVQIPPAGGDTCFASMYAAYDDLSPRMQATLEGLNAVHDIVPMLQKSVERGLIEADLEEMRQAWPSVEHPVVCTHPETGRKLLYVNANWTTRLCGMEPDERDSLLRFLLHHVGSPQFQCRFRWTTNAVAFWDNRAVQHFAVADYTERRVMHRVTVAAEGRPHA